MLETIKWNGYKLLVKNHGLLFLAIAAALMLLGALLPININQYKGNPATAERMEEYYQEYGGGLDQEIVNRIEEKKSEIEGAVREQEALFAAFDSREITVAELEKGLKEVNPLVHQQSAFREFYSSYLYCKEDPDQRHLVDVKGWRPLLDLKEPDFLLMFCVVIVSALLCGADLRQRIRPVLHTTVHGFAHDLYSKWVLIAFMAVALGLIFQLMTMGKYGLYFSYQEGNAPIQSIAAYAQCSASLSVWQTFLSGSCIRMFGLVYVGIVTVCAMELRGSASKGGLLSLAAVVVPYFAGYRDSMYLNWPAPAGLVQAYMYLAGNPAGNDVNPITLSTLARVVLMASTIMVLLGVVTWRFTRPGRGILKKRSKRK